MFRPSTGLLCTMLFMLGNLAKGEDKSLVYASKWFEETAPRLRKYVETDRTQILVFDEAKSPYILNGSDLDVDADVVRIIGKVEIRAYAANTKAAMITTTPADKPQASPGLDGNCNRSGCPGADGNVGNPGTDGNRGAHAGTVKLKIRTVDGNGTLTINNFGGKGGDGGTGGLGQSGGNGGRGSDPSCGDSLGRDQDGSRPGGPGGSGGIGGVGGMAGKGGDGGTIAYHETVKPLLESGRILLAATGGEPGSPGEGGFGGNGGLGGEGGQTKVCGLQGTFGGSSPGPLGAALNKQRGPLGGANTKGADGSIYCYNCIR